MQMATPCSSWITHEVSLARSIAFQVQYKVGLTLGTLKGRAGSTLTPDPSETRQLPIVFFFFAFVINTVQRIALFIIIVSIYSFMFIIYGYYRYMSSSSYIFSLITVLL